MSPRATLTITPQGLHYQGPLGEECFAWEHLTDLTTQTFTLMGILQISSPSPIENPTQYTPTLGEPILPLALFNPTTSFEKINQKELLQHLEHLHQTIKITIQRLATIAPELSPKLLVPLAKLRSRLGAR